MKKFLAGMFSAGMLVAVMASATEVKSERQKTIVQALGVKSSNGGINPDHKALEITLTVMTGSNPCMAEGVQVSVERSEQEDGIHITAVKSDTAPADRICTMEYNPQYSTLTTYVNYNSTVVHDVLIENYQNMDHTVSALSFLRTE